jgi:predicted transport protein
MFIKLGDLASGKVVTLGDMFAFENTTKMLDGMAATADAAGTTAKATGAVSANTKTAADDATRYADQMKLAAKLAEETASNQEKLEGIIRDMRTEYNEKTKIGGDLEARKKEVDAIRLLFDKTTMDDRTDANWFEHLIETGQDYNKFLDKMLDENQLAKLAEFRALANSTAELERQEQIKKEGDKLRQAMLEKAKGLMRDVDPVGKYIADLKDVQALRDAGMINEKAFVMEKNRLESELLKSRGTGTKVEAAKSFEVGSQEAYKFLVDQQTGKVNEQLQEQRKQTIALEVQNRTLRDIEAKIEPMRARR